MPASYIVRYQGSAPEPDRFLDYYRASHAPILQRFPGIGSLVLHRQADFTDPFPVNPGGNLLIAQMTFDDIPALNAALASPARAEARERPSESLPQLEPSAGQSQPFEVLPEGFGTPGAHRQPPLRASA